MHQSTQKTPLRPWRQGRLLGSLALQEFDAILKKTPSFLIASFSGIFFCGLIKCNMTSNWVLQGLYFPETGKSDLLGLSQLLQLFALCCKLSPSKKMNSFEILRHVIVSPICSASLRWTSSLAEPTSFLLQRDLSGEESAASAASAVGVRGTAQQGCLILRQPMLVRVGE